MRRRVAWLSIAPCIALLAGCLSAARPALVPPPVDGSGGAVELLAQAMGNRPLVLLGEMHGTREIPALVADLVADRLGSGERVVLALEIGEREQPAVDRYLSSGGTAADRAALLAGEHWTEPTHDGRDSRAMYDLIERMRLARTDGRDIAVLPFDAGGPDRSRSMADRIRQAVSRHPQARTVVLAGNVHAMTAPPPWPMLDEGKPVAPPMSMGRLLGDLSPLSIHITAPSGAYWTCVAGVCGPQPAGSGPVPPRPQLRVERADQPWRRTLVLPSFSASPPAVQAEPR